MKKLLFISIPIVFVSCNDIDFRVTNNTDAVIDSMMLSNGIDETAVYNIPPKGSVEGYLNFSSEVKTDGNYELKVYSGGIAKSRRFGYYSNGTPTDSDFDFIIENDTIIVRESSTSL